MFKFIKQYAETMDNIAIYPMISMFIFLAFFIVLIVYVIKMDKKSVEVLSNIPLDNSGDQNNQTI